MANSMKKLSKSAHHHLPQEWSKERQSALAHTYTEVSELFSLIRFILLVRESINFMTFAQKHMDLLQS